MEKEEIVQETVETSVPVVSKKNRAKIGEVNCDQLNLREEPSTDADILLIIKKGDPVSILEESKGFYKVLTNGIIGYCVKEFITVK